MRIRSTTPVNSRSDADGDLDGHRGSPESLLNALQRAAEVGALPVELVDDDGAGQLVFVGELPDLFGLHLHAGDRVYHDQGGIRRHQGRARVVDEDVVAGRIEEVDLGLFPFATAMAVEILILRWISSSSKSVIVLPSSTRSRRLVAPAVNSNAAVSVVLPESPWPTTPTFRMSLVS